MLTEFTFCILAYNHQEYVIEHLESIKHQIENYGANIRCHLVISDDCSRDNTVVNIERWLQRNDSLFESIVKVFNNENVGTCKCTINICEQVSTEHFKITAADDIYSLTNIFKFASGNKEFSLLSAIPVRIYDGVVKSSFVEQFNYVASDVIYKRKPFLDRLAQVSIINAPNLFYSYKYIKDKSILRFLSYQTIIEDYSLQIAISVEDPDSFLKSIDTPLVLYRRTSSSAFIIVPESFKSDKNSLFDYIAGIYLERKRYFKYLLVLNRKFLFNSRIGALNKLLNLSVYLYFFKALYKLPSILARYKSLEVDNDKIQEHYNLIESRAEKFLQSEP